ncbi:MAG: pyridoxamine 5'-phosphate oxidase family protein [Rhodocyclaceae bacterium]|nr:pyridoxamine 5'-phosphate oxidase family protein [Rhodocyclaceae bacterium]
MKLDPREARLVLASADFVALATQSARMPGFPFVSHAPFARDGQGAPLLLLSRLAEHSRNLGSNARVSLMVALGDADPQSQPRVTLVGELRTASVTPAQQDRYVRYHPEAGGFLGFGDFRFYRLEVARVRLVGGFARAGWIEAAEWRSEPLAEKAEAALLARLQGDPCVAGRRLLGLDREGVDLRDAAGARRRLSFRAAPGDDEALFEAARNALSKAS